ncbi:MAG: 2-(3-amino-3-carboxypropyl)histidine synthase subunit 1/2 [Desulfurococcaceae archaeon]
MNADSLRRDADVLSNSRTVLLTAPDGLKHVFPCMRGLLTALGAKSIVLSSSPSYGSCDIPVEEAIAVGADVIVHVGHEPYPMRGYDYATKVLYVPAYTYADLPQGFLGGLVDFLRSRGFREVVVGTNYSERIVALEVAQGLRDRGVKVVNDEPLVILGCIFPAELRKLSDARVLLVVAGGFFHALGAVMAGVPRVVGVDPFRQAYYDANAEAARYLAKRYFLAAKLRNEPPKLVGIVVGSRPGQYRPWLVEALAKILRERSVDYVVISSTYLRYEDLVAVDRALRADAYVVTSCPRLPIDDLSDFHKPVLTPGELMFSLGAIDSYRYPW